MSLGVQVAKNSLFLVLAEPVRRLISLVTVILIARHLSVDDWGMYSFASALVLLVVGLVTNFGTTSYVTREIARDRSRAAELTGDALSARTVTFAVSAPCVYLFAYWRGYDPVTLEVLLLVTLGTLFDQWADAYTGVFDGFQRMEFSALVAVFRSVASLLAVLAVVLAGWGARGLAATYNLVYLTAYVASAYYVRRHLTPVRLTVSPRRIGRMLAAGWPFLAINALWIVSFHVDKVMLYEMLDDRAVGYYNTAYRLFEVLIALPFLLGRALYPAFSEQVGKNDREGIRRLLVAAVRVMGLVGVPVCVGVVLTGPLFVRLLFSDKYAPSGFTLALFGAILWMWFLSASAGWALTAMDRLRVVFLANAGATALNIAANLLLIPRFSYNGAAAATGLSELVLVTAYGVVVQREVGVYRIGLIPWKPLFAAAGMGAAVLALLRATGDLPLAVQALVVVPAAAAVYVTLLLLLRGVEEDEKALLLRALARLRRR